MTDVVQASARTGLRRNFRDNGDTTYAEEFGSQLRAWNPITLTWTKVVLDNASGGLVTSGGGGGGGGAATIADGADVAQGTTTDASSVNTVVGILKAIKAAITGTLAVSGTFWQATQPVSIASMPSTPVTGPLTDTQLRATPVPVSGTVVANAGTNLNTAALALEAGGNLAAISAKDFATQTTLALIKAKTDNLDVALSTRTKPADAQHVIVDSSAAVPVTDNGGTLTVDAPVGTPLWVRESDGAAAFVGQKAMAASKPVVIASDQSAIPVSDGAGTLTVDAPVGTPVFARLSDGAAALVGSKVSASSLPVVIASDQAAVPVTVPTLTKGTQNAQGLSVQDLKDSGRVNIALTIEFAFAQTAETLLTVTESRDGAATATFTSKTITSGKRIRFTGGFAIIETLGTGTTVPQRMYLRLRVNTAGATVASSPLQYVFGLGILTGSAAIPVKTSNSSPIVIPDGVEYAGNGTVTYGLTLETPDWVITTGTGRCKITLFAFEY